jgi:hypothetical protein
MTRALAAAAAPGRRQLARCGPHDAAGGRQGAMGVALPATDGMALHEGSFG